MPTAAPLPSLYPAISPYALLAFQFSSWYPRFSSLTPKSTIIRPLPAPFVHYLHADGVFVPEGSEDLPTGSTLSDDDSDGDDNDADDGSEESDGPKFAFPELDAKIRSTIVGYGAVFPKLNFSSPKDASWILPSSSPLKCTSPADVYMLLKSSDFVLHDIDPIQVFEGCAGEDPAHGGSEKTYELELVLRKWYPMDRGREMRCFVRQGMLIGISQRDTNYYEFLNESSTRETILDTIITIWDTKIRTKWDTSRDYTFDVHLTRTLTSLHILDFNPYLPRTDPLLFTYEDLLALLLVRATSLSSPDALNADAGPELRVITSRTHPAANRNAPAHQHNMVPIEALQISSGRDIEQFADAWKEEVRAGMASDASDDA